MENARWLYYQNKTFKIMAYKITDTGNGIRIQIKNSIIDLTYRGAAMLATLLKDSVDKRKEKKL